MASNDGRKIPPHFENPIDNIFIDVASAMKYDLHALGIHPNHVTVASFVVACISAALIYKNHFIAGAILFAVSYLLDCLDGNMARTFDQVSEFGDKLDHILDIIKSTILTFAVGFNPDLDVAAKVVFGVMFSLLGFLTSIHLGCQEHYYERNMTRTPSMLRALKGYCTDPNQIVWTKYIGVGTLTTATISLLVIFGLEHRFLKFRS